jgi:hypothetical protein
MADLTNSIRIALKASYVSVALTPAEQRERRQGSGDALGKANHLHALALGPEAFARLDHALSQVRDEGRRARLQEVLALSRDLAAPPPTAPLHLARRAAAISASSIEDFIGLAATFHPPAKAQAAIYQDLQKVAPIGKLYLERIEMFPIGMEQGELVFTVPLAPGESCTISHKEWSTSSQEYEDIVQDYFERFSEKGVAEKSDVSMSLESESRRANTLDFSASVSGSYGPVSVTTQIGLKNEASERSSVKRSSEQSREITEKASARTRKEHKVSVKLEARRGEETESFRTVKNESATHSLRVDYFRMMRKWRHHLYRYGLRLTYDIAIPNPGSRLWLKYRKIAELDDALRRPFDFNISPTTITDANWQGLGAGYGTALDPPPPPGVAVTISRVLSNPNGGVEIFEFVAPEGYRLAPDVTGKGSVAGPGASIASVSYTAGQVAVQEAPSTVGKAFKVRLKDALVSATRAACIVTYAGNLFAALELRAQAKRDEGLFKSWQARSLEALRNGAAAQYQERLSLLQSERDRLVAEVTEMDTLTLRRLEREEFVRLVVIWLLGPSLPLTATLDIETIIKAILDGEANDKPDLTVLTSAQWGDARLFGELVKFIHQAVEWENMLSFFYPYFWGSTALAREKMLFNHPDPTHREFLRAGYARVVIPIRPGFEADFVSFVENGSFDGASQSPYMTIAEEIRAKAQTNYAGIPPANPEQHARPLLYPQQRTTWERMEAIIAAIDAYHVNNGTYPAKLSDLGPGPYADAWGNKLVYAFPGSGNDYDLMSLGADGQPGGEGLNADISAAAGASLIASWFDYTPTSGLDIELTAKPAMLPPFPKPPPGG